MQGEGHEVTQLNPSIPVYVVEQLAGFPTGTGQAVGWIDYGQEHHVLWGVAYDDGGAVFWVPNPFIRLQFNLSAGQRPMGPRPAGAVE
jgi:hypothetical protein